METVSCDYCGSKSYTTKFEINVSDQVLRYYRYARNIPNKEEMTGVQTIVTCDDCGLMYTNPRFNTEELNLVYSSEKIIGGNWRNFWYLFDSNAPDAFESGERVETYNPNLYQWKFDIIEKYCGKPEGKQGSKLRLLDIGCGDGKFVHDAIERGYDAMGVDLSPDRVAKGKALHNLQDHQIACMNVDDFEGEDKFDIIVMWDVIEHVESPSSLLQSIQKIAHKDTKIFALTMSIDSITYKLFKEHWTYINPTQHLHYFSHNTMEKLFAKCNFKLLGVEMDNSKNKNVIHLCARILVGQLNQFFFWMFAHKKGIRKLFKPFYAGISDERMMLRLENLHPGKYIGRYHDNYVFVGELEK
ncbi:class I SAM-dependent methyltransferase [Balneola vulgaris]|uniref:class I SAM-dependent methyltransferase n=1 Tax=Balneola vulgaris TaxID=287535 RepID=UPI00039BE73B|nr:class I SAM-dependent methyltransferase [Balneola vulgaris]